MTTIKKLGIWMDHANAHVMELSANSIETKIITSKFTHEEKENSIRKNENLMHNKEQHQQKDYYKQLGEIIKQYDEVILFGPTDAKSELLNYLRRDHFFSKIKIEIKSTDKMTENEKYAFVKDYFLLAKQTSI